MIQELGLVASFAILAAYAHTEFKQSRIFTWANGMLWPFIVIAALEGAAYGPALLSLGFGAVAIVKLVTYGKHS